MVQFGSIAFHVAKGGLPLKYWGLSAGIGAFELIVQQIINVLFRFGQYLKLSRNKNRSRKIGQLTTQRTNSAERQALVRD